VWGPGGLVGVNLEAQAVAGVDQLDQKRKAVDRFGLAPDQLATVMLKQFVQRLARHRAVFKHAVLAVAVDDLPRFPDGFVRGRDLAFEDVAHLRTSPDAGLVDRREFQGIQ